MHAEALPSVRWDDRILSPAGFQVSAHFVNAYVHEVDESEGISGKDRSALYSICLPLPAST